MNDEYSQQDDAAILHQNMMAARDSFVSKVFNGKLAALRAQNPFLPIVPTSDKVVNLSTKANIPLECILPSGTKMIMIRRSLPNSTVIASFNGTAQNFAAPSNSGVIESDSGSFVVNDNVFMYVEEIQSLSFLTPFDATISVMCWIQL
ncbi:MAG: hypothetical protein KGM99_12265 [Burkholderiales bacterium]|nr:hypothetical protein [Burkholderiales bacterium]